MGAAKRRAARHGVPRAFARARSRGPHRASPTAMGGEGSRGSRPPATVGGDRPHANTWASGRFRRAGVSPSPTQRRGVAVRGLDRSASLPRLHGAGRRTPEVPRVRGRSAGGRLGVELGAATPRPARSLHWLVGTGAATKHSSGGVQHEVFDFTLGRGPVPRLARARAHGAHAARGVAAGVRAPGVLRRDLRRCRALSGHVLPGGELDFTRAHERSRQGRPHPSSESAAQGHLGLSAGEGLPRAALEDGAMSSRAERRRAAKKMKRRELKLEELQAIVERARVLGLTEEEHATLAAAVETLAFVTQELEAKGNDTRAAAPALVRRGDREDEPGRGRGANRRWPRRERASAGRGVAANANREAQGAGPRPQRRGSLPRGREGRGGARLPAPRRRMSRLHQGQSLSRVGAGDAAARPGDGPAAGYGLRVRPSALQSVRGGVHGPGARGGGRREIRRDGGEHDRPSQVRGGIAVQSHREARA